MTGSYPAVLRLPAIKVQAEVFTSKFIAHHLGFEYATGRLLFKSWLCLVPEKKRQAAEEIILHCAPAHFGKPPTMATLLEVALDISAECCVRDL